GGRGSDRLFSGAWTNHRSSAGGYFEFWAPKTSSDVRDWVGCGPGADYAISDKWDVLRACENVRLRR
ncbi:MAG TPA: hypothetical protein VFN82_05975, partial [Solirubrobacterales bacterium]|nr:hypothetical protein [Solirubrobacterales bacterium]